jgi:hypothetical protein
MLPYEGIGIGTIGIVYKLGKIIKGIEVTDSKIDKLIGMEERLNKIETEHSLAMNGKLKLH